MGDPDDGWGAFIKYPWHRDPVGGKISQVSAWS